MLTKLESLGDALQKEVERLDPDVLTGPDAARLVEAFTRIERLSAAGKALAAGRVAASGAWQSSGERSPAHWMAKTTGTSVGEAAGLIETAARLKELASTSQALRAGELSAPQVKEIASAAAAAPAAEAELLQAAQSDTLMGLKERCAQVRAAALPDENERYARIRARRRLRHWTDPDGAFRLEALLTPDAGACVLAALEPVKERVFQAARKAGIRESYEAYAADALVAVCADARDCGEESGGGGPKALVHVLVDHNALTRGEVAAGETCEIAGVGPIPAATARALASDSILSALVTDGSDIRSVCNMGRTIPARLRTALLARDRKCCVPGCDARDHLQIDHIKPLSEGGRTTLENLDRICPHHHYLKTHRGYGLGGPPGARTWEPPDRAGPVP